jgi:SET domain-containing protein
LIDGCAPNLRVHKFTTLGEGVEEYEVGFWATRNIAKGEELFYDYNVSSFQTLFAYTGS